MTPSGKRQRRPSYANVVRRPPRKNGNVGLRTFTQNVANFFYNLSLPMNPVPHLVNQWYYWERYAYRFVPDAAGRLTLYLHDVRLDPATPAVSSS